MDGCGEGFVGELDGWSQIIIQRFTQRLGPATAAAAASVPASTQLIWLPGATAAACYGLSCGMLSNCCFHVEVLTVYHLAGQVG